MPLEFRERDHFYNSETVSVSQIRVVVDSGLSGDLKTYIDKNHSGTYSFHSKCNNRPVYKVKFNCKKAETESSYFKRDIKTEQGDQLYIWHHTNGYWLLNGEQNFQNKNNHCYMYKKSTGMNKMQFNSCFNLIFIISK